MFLPTTSWSLSSTTSNKRDGLVSFWLHVPSDRVQALWESDFGSQTIKLIQQLNDQTEFTDDQVSLRSSLGDFFSRNGLNHELSLQFMIANFLLSPPGLLVINNIESFFPNWFVHVYKSIYVFPQSSPSQFSEPTPNPPAPPISATTSPDFGSFPTSLNALVSDRIHLNRLLGLSNLFYIDPDDQDILKELLDVRRNLALAIFDCPESDLEGLWSGELGDRYWSLVRSGIQSVTRSPEDNSLFERAVITLDPGRGGGFDKPGSVNAFLVSMIFFEPGTMKVDQPQDKIPSWLLDQYLDIFANALPFY